MKPRCGGRWTEARMNSFITSALRAAHGRWAPRHDCKKEAWVKRGFYRCAGCNTIGPATLPPLEGNIRRRNNVCIDHIEPVVDPSVGFTSWDEYIDRMFVEVDKYQVLCYNCHKDKTNKEREIATKRRKETR